MLRLRRLAVTPTRQGGYASGLGFRPEGPTIKRPSHQRQIASPFAFVPFAPIRAQKNARRALPAEPGDYVGQRIRLMLKVLEFDRIRVLSKLAHQVVPCLIVGRQTRRSGAKRALLLEEIKRLPRIKRRRFYLRRASAEQRAACSSEEHQSDYAEIAGYELHISERLPDLPLKRQKVHDWD